VTACGGVASNQRLRDCLTARAEADALGLFIASPAFCTDNAAMVAGLGWHRYQAGCLADLHADARPRWRPDEA
jgi:N6-L-threonylcarbamoyladenine synthase